MKIISQWHFIVNAYFFLHHHFSAALSRTHFNAIARDEVGKKVLSVTIKKLGVVCVCYEIMILSSSQHISTLSFFLSI
jgi:hypothetical protein